MLKWHNPMTVQNNQSRMITAASSTRALHRFTHCDNGQSDETPDSRVERLEYRKRIADARVHDRSADVDRQTEALERLYKVDDRFLLWCYRHRRRGYINAIGQVVLQAEYIFYWL